MEVVCGIQLDWGKSVANHVAFLSVLPIPLFGCPLTNRTPGFFDLLTRQQDYSSDSARPLHFRTRINRGDQSRVSLLFIFLLGSKLWSA